MQRPVRRVERDGCRLPGLDLHRSRDAIVERRIRDLQPMLTGGEHDSRCVGRADQSFAREDLCRHRALSASQPDANSAPLIAMNIEKVDPSSTVTVRVTVLLAERTTTS